MSMAAIPGQIRARKLLQRMAARGRVPHALLFTGETGIGKSGVARGFAKVLNCTDPRDGDSCDQCASCRKIDSGQHPDVLWITKEGAFIKIDQVRRIQERLKYRPFEAKCRVIVMEDAHDLREEAANAFLKILEEPPRRNVFILISMEPRMILPTIVSRCCHIRFQPLDEEIIARVIAAERGIEPGMARRPAAMASGSLDRARLLTDSETMTQHEEIRKRIEKLASLSMMDFFSLTARWAKETRSLEEDLEYIKLWLRNVINDLLQARFASSPGGGRPWPGAHSDGVTESLFRLFDVLERAHQQLRVNANRQLVLEGVCLAIRKAFDGESHRYTFSTGGQNILL
ncbi:MAG: DNA polymerase III subunit delta' [Syntrophobacteraceae bacterium]|nr:DNA polymerase III subunit delta' [Syntrophobacteraceae bacterium]